MSICVHLWFRWRIYKILFTTEGAVSSKDEASAEETVNRFLEAQREGRIKEPDDVSLFVKSMTGELACAA